MEVCLKQRKRIIEMYDTSTSTGMYTCAGFPSVRKE